MAAVSHQGPHFRVAEGHLGWMTIGYIWVSNKPNLAVAVGAIFHTNDLLMVYVKRDGVPVCFHGDEINLVQSLFNCRGEILNQNLNVCVICIEQEIVRPI